jgi:hypothetical protein
MLDIGGADNKPFQLAPPPFGVRPLAVPRGAVLEDGWGRASCPSSSDPRAPVGRG